MDFAYSIKAMGHEQVIYCQDPRTGLRAIIAIHNTTLGPALGGCRFWDYPTDQDALTDVLRLSRGMTYKAAISGLTLGGGKSVIIGDPKVKKTPELLRSFGRFVNTCAGRYITAEDVNINVKDMNTVAEETRYVTGTSKQGGSGDPSPITALGIYHGIRAALQFRNKNPDVEGIRLAVQGLGSVGSHLCRLLYSNGADLTVSDINQEAVKRVQAEFPRVKTVPPQDIHKVDADIFTPCALGGCLNSRTIPEIRAKIVAGGANNQLLNEADDIRLLEKHKILLAPDYVINAGGLISVYHELKGSEEYRAKKDAETIQDTMLKIFYKSEEEDISTLEASNRMAEKIIRDAYDPKKYLARTFETESWIKHHG